MLIQSAAGTNAATPGWYYIVGTLIALGGLLFGAWRWYEGARRRLVDEAQFREQQAEAIKANTRANSANTSAIATLTARMETFTDAVREDLVSHGTRLTKLEIRRGHRKVIPEEGDGNE